MAFRHSGFRGVGLGGTPVLLTSVWWQQAGLQGKWVKAEGPSTWLLYLSHSYRSFLMFLFEWSIDNSTCCLSISPEKGPCGIFNTFHIKNLCRNSLAVPSFRLHAPTAGSMGLIPGGELRSCRSPGMAKKKNKQTILLAPCYYASQITRTPPPGGGACAH